MAPAIASPVTALASRPAPALPARPDASAAPLLAADVGGTHVRVGLVEADTDPDAPLAIRAYRRFACADYPGLAEVLEAWLAGLDGPRPTEAVIAIAGYALDDGRLVSANLPWPVAPSAIRARLGFDLFAVVNDFEAVAHAAAELDAGTLLHLSGPRESPDGPVLVAGPGTGFGAAVWMPARGGAVVLATEAGQAALPAGDAREHALVGELLRAHGRVPVELALSGPGLLRLHAALARVEGRAPRDFGNPGDLTAAALADGDPDALATLDAFCALLGGTVGSLALLYGIRGGVHLAGGVLAHLHAHLARSPLVARFLGDGPMRAALERVPLKVVDHGRLGVVGAARWYRATHAASPRQAAR